MRHGVKSRALGELVLVEFVLVGLLLAGHGSFGAQPSAAQTPPGPVEGFGHVPRVGFGFVANAPEIRTGVAAWGVTNAFGGLGLYVDVKMNLDTPADRDDFMDGLSPGDVNTTAGQRHSHDQSVWSSYNAALLRPVSRELMLYLGAGYVERDVFARFMDRTGDLDRGTLGWYWVYDESESAVSLNLLGGAFFRMGSRVAFQFGFETLPAGMSVGLSYSLPLR